MFTNLNRIYSFLSEDIDQCRIIVIGDVMLDRYYYGDVKRISPEAPVPIANVQQETETLGGAANVAHNLARLGCRVFLGGAAGADACCNNLMNLLDLQGIDHTGLVTTDRPTTAKLRIISSHQQMMRIDFEIATPLPEIWSQKLIQWFNEKITAEIDGVIISDYHKGVCTPELCQTVIQKCNQMGIPVLVDPKGTDWEKYSGSAFITPNTKELGEALGRPVANEDQPVEAAAGELRKCYNIGNVVVTRSEKGISLVNDAQIVHIPTRVKDVFDVSGAGDTVSAVLCAAISKNLEIKDALKLANLAAGIVVGKVGTYPISKAELVEGITEKNIPASCVRKIIPYDAVTSLVDSLRHRGSKIVFSNGCFDILHAGHVSYLEKAKQMGDVLIIGLNSDASVCRLKGPKRPVIGEMDRAKLLAGLECVDYVIIFEQDTPAELIHFIQPDILVKGGDYRVEEVAGRQDAGKVELITFETGYSTSEIISRILQRYQEPGG